MTPQPHTAPAWITVHDFIERYLLGDRHSAYPVKERSGSISGLITLAQLRQVEPGNRSTTRIGEIAVPLSRVPIATPDEPVTALLERLASAETSRALVVDGGCVVGIVTPSDLTRLVDVYRLASPPTRRRSPALSVDFLAAAVLPILRDKVFWVKTTAGIPIEQRAPFTIPRVLARRTLSRGQCDLWAHP